VKVNDADLPGRMLTDVADANIENVGAGTIFKVRIAECVMPPPVTFTLGAYVPLSALDVTVNVSRLVPYPGAAMLEGEKLALTPAGNSLTEKATAASNPDTGTVVKVTSPEPEGVTFMLCALAARAKFGTSTMRVAVSVRPPPVAVSVSA
jgi:hypothetical protein